MPITKPPHGDDLRRLGALSELLKVKAQNTPDMSVQITRGGFWKDETTWIETPNSTVSPLAAPMAGARYDVVCIRDNGMPIVIQGMASNNPDLPAIPDKYLPLAAIFMQQGVSQITDAMIYDLRPFLRAGSPSGDHQKLANRNLAGMAHTISAIAGLEDALNEKTTLTEVSNLMLTKADADGTSSVEFTLNKGAIGIAGPDVMLKVDRGIEPTVAIKWNEVAELWEFTNDGFVWQSFSSPELGSNVINYGHLDVALQGIIDGKADDVHTHDDRYYTEGEVDGLLLGKADAAHTHDLDGLGGLLLETQLPHNISADKIGNGVVSSAEYQRLSGARSNLQDQIDAKADNIHKHDASDIETGTLDVGLLPTGIPAVNIADGSVDNTKFEYLNTLSSNVQDQIDAKADSVHTHDASDIDSGVLHVDRIPSGIDAGKLHDGSVSNAEFGRLDGVTSNIQTQLNAKADDIHSHSAEDIGAGNVDNTEFGYLNGVSSNIQSQLDGKAADVHSHTSAQITNFSTEVQAAAVEDAINQNQKNMAPSQDAVFSNLALKSDIGHVHAGEDITSGTIDALRLPLNISAANIADGSVGNTEFQYLANVTSDVQNQIDTHTHEAADITDFATAAKAAVVEDAINQNEKTKAPSQDSVYVALSNKSDTGHAHVAADVTDFATEAKAAVVHDGIRDTEKDTAPSEDAVYNALAGKVDVGSDFIIKEYADAGTAPTPDAGTRLIFWSLDNGGELTIKDSSGNSTAI